MKGTFIVPGLRTPFAKEGAELSQLSALEISTELVRAVATSTPPDLVVWSQLIPDPLISNIAREIVQRSGLLPSIPAFSTVLACASGILGAVQASCLLGSSGLHLALVGGVETLSFTPVSLRPDVVRRTVTRKARYDPQEAFKALQQVTPADFSVPFHGWTNRDDGLSQGWITEQTAKRFGITREHQDSYALESHRRATEAWKLGYFDKLLFPMAQIRRDSCVRADASLPTIAALPPKFDLSGAGTLTAGNSAPNADGCASVWVADASGLGRLGDPNAARVVDWQIAAGPVENGGALLAPAFAIPRLLERNGLRYADVDLWEMHEAFAAQIIANVWAMSDRRFLRDEVGCESDLGNFDWGRMNPHGGGIAIGHPFAATGPRLLSQAITDLHALSADRAVVSVSAAGGQAIAILLVRHAR